MKSPILIGGGGFFQSEERKKRGFRNGKIVYTLYTFGDQKVICLDTVIFLCFCWRWWWKFNTDNSRIVKSYTRYKQEKSMRWTDWAVLYSFGSTFTNVYIYSKGVSQANARLCTSLLMVVWTKFCNWNLFFKARTIYLEHPTLNLSVFLALPADSGPVDCLQRNSVIVPWSRATYILPILYIISSVTRTIYKIWNWKLCLRLNVKVSDSGVQHSELLSFTDFLHHSEF
jgi:hypothetical protein